ncbi:hypothetical protein Pfo_007856 [Paulownia fortunei]|nr:hypothetical protein Pfo_007856 [Paulownia fortunei]
MAIVVVTAAALVKTRRKELINMQVDKPKGKMQTYELEVSISLKHIGATTPY